MQFSVSKKIVRRMGYLADQRGIINRYLNEEGGWNSHLEKTKNFIKRSAITKNKGTVAVLGSGWLLDVPIEYLAHEFKTVYCIDIIHPPQIQKKLSCYSNVRMLTTDLSGGAVNQIYYFTRRYKKYEGVMELEQLAGDSIHWDYPVDFVISLNILNQLDIVLIDFIRKYKIFTKEEENALRKIIQEHHLRSLPEQKSCIITDSMEHIKDPSGLHEEIRSLVYVQLPKGNFSEQWQWNFDMNKTYNKGKQTVFSVVAIDL